jgi:hypothetical protein
MFGFYNLEFSNLVNRKEKQKKIEEIQTNIM